MGGDIPAARAPFWGEGHLSIKISLGEILAVGRQGPEQPQSRRDYAPNLLGEKRSERGWDMGRGRERKERKRGRRKKKEGQREG